MSDHDCYSCEEALKRLDDYVDRELSIDEIDEVKTHLQACKGCSEHFSFEVRVVEEVRRKLERLDIPDDLRNKVFSRLAAESSSDHPRA